MPSVLRLRTTAGLLALGLLVVSCAPPAAPLAAPPAITPTVTPPAGAIPAKETPTAGPSRASQAVPTAAPLQFGTPTGEQIVLRPLPATLTRFPVPAFGGAKIGPAGQMEIGVDTIARPRFFKKAQRSSFYEMHVNALKPISEFTVSWTGVTPPGSEIRVYAGTLEYNTDTLTAMPLPIPAGIQNRQQAAP